MWSCKYKIDQTLLSVAGFPGGTDGKKSVYNAVDLGSVPGSERPPGEGNDNPLQFSSMGNPIDREAWWVTVHGIIENRDNLVNKQQQ